MISLDVTLIGLTHISESLIQSIFDEPNSRCIEVGHDSRTLNLEIACCVVEVESNHAWDSTKYEVELNHAPFFNQGTIKVGCHSRAGEGYGVHWEGETFRQSAEGRLHYLIIETRVAKHIHIFPTW